MKCPFCGAELLESVIDFELFCDNEKCRYYQYSLPKEIWQALIDGKKAQDALNYALEVLSNLDGIGGVDLEIVKIKEIATGE